MTHDYSKPFKVRIIEDCRQVKNKLDGQYGTCLGEYEYPHIDRKKPENIDDNPKNILKYNPLIQVDGKYIWGIECWFESAEQAEDVPLDVAKAELEKVKESMLRRAKQWH